MSQLQVTGEAKIRDIQGPVVANDGVVTALDGAASQYVRGDGTLADFPTSSGGGSSVSYYLNSSVSQGTIGGVAYRELSKDPIIGAGTDIPISTNGYVANYITDANDPDVVIVPGGNFNCEFYFSVNNNTGNPTTYAELYKYDGTTFTLLGTSAGVPESINQGTTIAPYYFAIPVATAALSVTDRLAIRIYVNVDGRTVTLHTENGHLCQVVTTLSKGMVSLNNLTDQSQYLATGTSGTNFAIVSSGDTHTFNLPVASATNTGKLSSTDWSTFNGKQPAGNYVTLDTTQTITAAKTFSNIVTIETANYLTSRLKLNNTATGGNSWSLSSGNQNNSTNNGLFTIINETLSKNTFVLSPTGKLAIGADLGSTNPADAFSVYDTNTILKVVDLTGNNSNVNLQATNTAAYLRAGYTTTAIPLIIQTGNTDRLTISANGDAITLASNVTTTGAQFVQNGFYLTNANAGAIAGYTHMWGRNEGINFGLRNGTGGASFIFQSATSYDYTFPAATGTLALTSNLSAYLPLTGGTLTGALSGTSASFSSTVTAVGYSRFWNGTTGLLVGAFSAGAGYGAIYSTGVTPSSTNFAIVTNGASTYLNATNDAGMTIDNGTKGIFLVSSGNVGIGTSSPSQALNVIGNARLEATIGNRYLEVQSSTSSLQFGTDGSSQFIYGSGSFPLTFSTAATERMRITSGGNVGIGTSSPNVYGGFTNLQVNGTSNGLIQVSGASSTLGSFYAGNGQGQIGTSSNHPFVLFTNDVEKIRITSGGLVGIGTSSPSYLLQLNSDSAAKPTSALWTIASDERIKENINPYNKGLQELLKINPVTYDYNGLGGFVKGKGGVGIIAQEIINILPNSVSSIKGKLNETDEQETDILNFNGHELIYVLINSIKEQQAQIEQLKSLINK